MNFERNLDEFNERLWVPLDSLIWRTTDSEDRLHLEFVRRMLRLWLSYFKGLRDDPETIKARAESMQEYLEYQDQKNREVGLPVVADFDAATDLDIAVQRTYIDGLREKISDAGDLDLLQAIDRLFEKIDCSLGEVARAASAHREEK